MTALAAVAQAVRRVPGRARRADSGRPRVARHVAFPPAKPPVRTGGRLASTALIPGYVAQSHGRHNPRRGHALSRAAAAVLAACAVALLVLVATGADLFDSSSLVLRRGGALALAGAAYEREPRPSGRESARPPRPSDRTRSGGSARGGPPPGEAWSDPGGAGPADGTRVGTRAAVAGAHPAPASRYGRRRRRRSELVLHIAVELVGAEKACCSAEPITTTTAGSTW